MMKKNHEEKHKGKHKTELRIKIYCVLMGVISFLLCFAAGSLILRYMEKEQKDMAVNCKLNLNTHNQETLSIA